MLTIFRDFPHSVLVTFLVAFVIHMYMLCATHVEFLNDMIKLEDQLVCM